MTPNRSILCVLALFLALGACVPPEPEEDLIRDFDPETTIMGAIQEAGLLRVGVTSNQALHREDGGEVTGLAADLATEISDTLGVEPEFTVASNDSLLQMVQDGDVDLAFPVVPVVEKLVRTSGVSDPYFMAHQRLLVLEGSGIEGMDDIEGEVCVGGDPETTLDVSAGNPDLEVTEALDVTGCYTTSTPPEDLPPISGLDIELVGAAYALGNSCGPEAPCVPFEVVGDELTTAGISMVVEKGASGWLGFVDNVLGEFKSEGLWLESYNESFESYLGPQRAPEITVEEAAALFPREL
jgi:polar amino acid transport system substrate-binding protein